MRKKIIDLLNKKVEQFNQFGFIENDPISIPHRFTKKQDIEISAFFAAIFAWGNRKTIINKTNELMQLMDESPHDFVINHQDSDLKRFLDFKHRTFNVADCLYFIEFLQHHYKKENSLETAFTKWFKLNDKTIENALIEFHNYFFSLLDFPKRTKKHIATPVKKSTCKRLNMFLRWMVRKDAKNVDFGIWNQIKMSQLMCPLDVHVGNIGRQLGLITRKQNDWQTVKELTDIFRKLDKDDPVKYDYALFGMGIEQKL